MRSGTATWPDADHGFEIGHVDGAVIDAEQQDQRDLGQEQHAEEKSEAAQSRFAAPLEADMVDAEHVAPATKNTGARIDARRRSDRCPIPALRNQAVNAPSRTKPGCAILTMSRKPNAIDRPIGDGGIETAEQQAGHDRVREKIEHRGFL